MGGNPVSNASQIETQNSLITPYTGFKNYTITSGKNAMSFGDITYNSKRNRYIRCWFSKYYV